MTKRGNFFLCYKRFTANRALLAVRKTCFRTRCCLSCNNFFCVSECRDYFLRYKNFATNRTFLTFRKTCFRTRCLLSKKRFFRVFCAKSNSAIVALIVGVFIRMTGCRDFFIRRIVTSRTRYVFFPTLFRTSCRLPFMLYFIMTKRITFRLSASFAGLRLRTSSVFPIVRQFFNRFVVTAQCFVPMIFAIRRPFRREFMCASSLFKLDIVQVNFTRLQRELNGVFTFFQSDIAEAVTRIRANPPLFQILAAD